jgi:protein phosphatase
MFKTLKSFWNVTEFIQVYASTVSFIGVGKQMQQDNFYMYPGSSLTAKGRTHLQKSRYMIYKNPVIENQNCFFCVSDGLGGYRGGEYASQLVVERLKQQLPAVIQNPNFSVENMKQLLGSIHQNILAQAKANIEVAHMAATLTGIWITEKEIYTVNIGDSCVYSYRNGHLQLLTVAQNVGNRLLKMGVLTPEQVQNFPDRKSMYSCMGISEEDGYLEIDINKVEDDGEDVEYFLICSDGLPNELERAQMENIISRGIFEKHTLEDIALCLAQEAETAARKKSKSTDNITVMLLAVVYI